MRRLARAWIPWPLCVGALCVGILACEGEEIAADAAPTDAAPDAAPDAEGWQAVITDYEPGALLSLWGSGPDDVWAVGGELGRSVVLHFDGGGWTEEISGADHQLWWIHGFGPRGPIFVVGEAGRIARRGTDGRWTLQESGVPFTTLYGVWGAAPDDVWAVGGGSRLADPALAEGDVLLHFDGQSWRRIEVPSLASDEETLRLFKVWGAGPDAVFVVGERGLALHYDGARWRRIETGVDATLFTVIGRAADDVWAVGGAGAGVLIHWDGEAWAPVALPPYTPPIVQGLWTAPGHPVYVSGYRGFAARLDATGDWSAFPSVTADGLHAIWGDGSGGRWAVGGDIVSALPDHHGVLLAGGRAVVPALSR